MIKLNIGCGIGLLAGFINIDKYIDIDGLREGHATKEGPYQNAIIEKEPDGSDAVYLESDVCKLALPDAFGDYILLNNVLEHLPMVDLLGAMREMRRVLKPGGTICIITPDFNGICRLWLDNVANKVGTFDNWDLFHYLAEVVYGNQCGEGEFHRSPITPDLLNYLFLLAGFEDVKIRVHPTHYPVPDYDGNRTALDSVVRSDTLVGYAAIPASVGGELRVSVSDQSSMGDGLR